MTAATRSLRFLCHRQRSVRSPHRPAPPHSMLRFRRGDPCGRPPITLLAKTVSLRGQFANWPWQSASPVPLAPLPKGGWHGEAVSGGFFFAPAPHTQKYRPKPQLRAVFLHNTIIHFMLPTDYKPAATMQSSTRVKITNTAPTHLVAFASLASTVRALPLDI